MSEIIGLRDNVIIVGKMQSGKTTIANYLVKNHDYSRIAIADPISEIILHIDSMSPSEIIKKFITPYRKLSWQKRDEFVRILDATRNIPREFPKPRKRMQFLGTDGVRKKIDNDFWLKIIWKKIEGPNKIVIDDCRLLNEYTFFRDKGFKDIKVDVSIEVQDGRLHQLYGGAYDKEILEHSSELDQSKINKKYPHNIIENNGTFEELYTKIEELLLNNEKE